MRNRTSLEYILMIRQLSYVQVSKEMNVSPQQFSDWLKKRRPVPLKYREKLLNIHKTSEEYIFDEGGKLLELTPLIKLLIQSNYIQSHFDVNDPENIVYKNKLIKVKNEIAIELVTAKLKKLLNHKDNNLHFILKEVDLLLEKEGIN